MVEANLAAAEPSDLAPGAVLNVAGGSSTTVNDVLALLGAISRQGGPGGPRDPVPGDVLRTRASTHAIRRATGWVPRTGLQEGLEEQYRWAAAVLVQ